MALVTPTEAIRLTGRSKAAFYKDVQAGRVSKTIKNNKTFFETSELLRAYGELKTENLTASKAEEQKDAARLAQMQHEIELLRALLTEKDAHISSLKDTLRLLEYSRNEQSQVVQDETSDKTKSKRKGLLGWFGGR